MVWESDPCAVEWQMDLHQETLGDGNGLHQENSLWVSHKSVCAANLL
jgi:hypothetical protein